jgi:hypothetical protein
LFLGETLFDDAFSLLSKGNVNPTVIIDLFKDLNIQKEKDCVPDVVLYEGVKKIVDNIGRIEDIGDVCVHPLRLCAKQLLTYVYNFLSWS